MIDTSPSVGISAISCFEVAWLEQHNRIRLPIELPDWFEKATTGSEIEILPITPEIATNAVKLPEHHSDPQDRLIMATAITHQAKLISADSKFGYYAELNSLLISVP
jgi:PIN domain nuclease of toxin-antitoxin system